MECGLDRSEAIKNFNHYTLVGIYMDRFYIDGRDNPYLIEMCELSNFTKINLQIKKYSDDEMRQRESRESVPQQHIQSFFSDNSDLLCNQNLPPSTSCDFRGRGNHSNSNFQPLL